MMTMTEELGKHTAAIARRREAATSSLFECEDLLWDAKIEAEEAKEWRDLCHGYTRKSEIPALLHEIVVRPTDPRTTREEEKRRVYERAVNNRGVPGPYDQDHDFLFADNSQAWSITRTTHKKGVYQLKPKSEDTALMSYVKRKVRMGGRYIGVVDALAYHKKWKEDTWKSMIVRKKRKARKTPRKGAPPTRRSTRNKAIRRFTRSQIAHSKK